MIRRQLPLKRYFVSHSSQEEGAHRAGPHGEASWWVRRQRAQQENKRGQEPLQCLWEGMGEQGKQGSLNSFNGL